ncbi:SAM-dependent methyltransferase [Azohydromonas sediminis]|uniref:SAM-dependent methyltransferase n=1 Tax=Azohydromonas sediminis TaxID=2259674 RepID=UPI000E659E26|nr:cyclopropane-fatty-acyl-phospholipid synthase family protein [Azohydromonas sediminis]
MSTTTTASLALPASAPRAARLVLNMLQHLQRATLDVQLPDGHQLRFGNPADTGPRGAIRLRTWDVCAAALKSGDIGFAESYIAGTWTTPDLAALLKVFIANRDAAEQLIYGSWWGSLAYRLKHLLHRNSRRGSRKNIHAHYDIGNSFYTLWLDETMNYSSAWFAGDTSRSLPDAQHAKVRRALAQCGIAPGGRLLEIGCGWGALAEIAARDFGAHVTGLTLSTEQLAHATKRLADAGLADRADLRLQDYRDVTDAPFDAICSIEMFEAVGREYWPHYFRTVHDKLKPGGRACIQTITIRDDLFERYVRSTDFIQQYIFPGGLLPSAQAFRAEAARAALRVVDEFAFGHDYAETLARWRTAFLQREPQVRKLGFDTRFMRTWEFYLAYCEAAFATGNTDVVQFTLQRDGGRP